MSRLIDRLYAQGSVHITAEHPQGVLRPIETLLDPLTGRPAFEDTTAFVIDNVTEYLFADNDQEHWTFEDDFPCVMLPFPSVWMETRRPSRILSREHPTRVPHEFPQTWGILLLAAPFRETVLPERPVLLAHMQRTLATHLPLIEGIVARAQRLGRQLTFEECSAEEQLAVRVAQQVDQLARMPEDDFHALLTHDNIIKGLHGRTPRWSVHGLFFVEYHNAHIVGPAAALSFYVDGLGKVIPVQTPTGHPLHLTMALFQPMTPPQQVRMHEELSAMLFPMWLALSFCHCKNVQIVPQTFIRHGKAQRYRGRPRVTYHTLNIQPMRTVLRSEGDSATTGLKRALSICRGHFKQYATGKGLFGKHHGLYWWEQHVRGSSQHGVAVSDYAVQPPPTAPALEA